ncbi:MAG: hypothetical protein V4671_27890 [Armatimonadota bacterium]
MTPNRDDSGRSPRLPRRQETSPELEAMDMFLAFPRRRRTGWSADFSQFRLECGHNVSCDLPLDDDAKVRCRECYREKMAKAARMIGL